MQPSRRAFLTGAARLGSPWGRFCARLARSTRGRLEDDGAPGQPGWARFEPARAEDMHHAIALCREAGVRLVPPGFARPAVPALLIDPIRLDRLEHAEGRALAEPGVRVGELRGALPGACAGAPERLSLLEWLAEPGWHAGWPPAHTASSGLAAADLVLADGTWQHAGPFGADTRTRPLEPAAARLVSSLFTLAHGAEAAALRSDGAPAWAARYRLDALYAQPPNLAHLLLGGAATLAWPERLWFEAVPASSEGAPAAPGPAGAALEAQVKEAFDPAGVFASLPAVV